MSSRFLSRDSWGGHSPNQLSRMEISSSYSNWFSMKLLVVENFIQILPLKLFFVLLWNLFCLLCFHLVTAPVNPPIVSAQSHSSTSISVQWSFNRSFENVLGILQGFNVHYFKQDGEDYALVTVDPNNSTITLVNVSTFTTYNITVGAFTQAGETKSIPVTVDTLQDGRI